MIKTFGERIKKLRESKGLTQDDLAKKLDLSFQHISNFEKNRRIPRLETFKKIAHFFDIKYEELLDIEIENENKEEIINRYEHPTDEQIDRFLADAFYSDNPFLLEQALNDKKNRLKELGINLDLDKFIHLQFNEQVQEALNQFNNDNYSLLGLINELCINYIVIRLREKNTDNLIGPINVLEDFISKIPKQIKQQYPKIYGGLIILFHIACQIYSYWENEEKIKGSRIDKSRQYIPYISREEKKELEKKAIKKTGRRFSPINAEDMREPIE